MSSLLLSPLRAQHRNIGVPIVQNYPKQQYSGGTQNWGFAQDDRGVLYVANNEGLLEYNGEDWNIHPLPNRTIARSVLIDAHKRIFVGGQDEFGFYSATGNGVLRFNSLKPLIPEQYRQFEDVWEIVAADDDILFRSSDRIYNYTGDTISVISTGNQLLFLGRVADKVFVQDLKKGLLEFVGDTLLPVVNGGFFTAMSMTASLSIGDTILFTTEKKGVYYYLDGKAGVWPVQHAGYLRNQLVQCAVRISGDRIALGTVLGGLVILDKSGGSQYVMTKKDGLQNNNVRSLFVDRDSNLWLGLDNGIDYILTRAPFTLLIPDDPLGGTAYAVEIHNGIAYFGTSNGLYSLHWKEHYDPFEIRDQWHLVQNTRGQVWGIDVVGDALFLGHHEGAFHVRNGSATHIDASTGYWTFLPVLNDRSSLIGGCYTGLRRFHDREGEWIFDKRLPGLNESCRIVAVDADGIYWISHPYRGIYRVTPAGVTDSIDVRFFGKRDGLPSDKNNFVVRINGQIIVCAERGVYSFDALTEQFIPHGRFTEIFGDEVQVRYMVEDDRGDIWYALNEEVGVLEVEDKGLTKTIRRRKIPELRGKLVGGFEHIYPHDRHSVFFGSDQGFIHYDPAGDLQRHSLPTTVISAVYGTRAADTLLYIGHQSVADEEAAPESLRVFPFRLRAFRFHYGATHFEKLTHVEYQCKLEGQDAGWLDWTTGTMREYTNLPAGSYAFQVRARLPGGEPGESAVYRFRILPPWYDTPLAYTLYGAFVVGVLVSLVLVPRYRYKKEREELQKEHKKKEASHIEAVQKSEAEIIRLRNEKLTADVRHRNRELASSTMHLVQKNALLTTIKDELDTIRQRSTEDRTKTEIRKLIRLLERDHEVDEDWDNFAMYFDQVYSDFFSRIREEYPMLTPKDHKLCAYLRMNLTSKEIAPLLNISVRGVEISRYRLRKKLQLEKGTNLNEFLNKF